MLAVDDHAASSSFTAVLSEMKSSDRLSIVSPRVGQWVAPVSVSMRERAMIWLEG